MVGWSYPVCHCFPLLSLLLSQWPISNIGVNLVRCTTMVLNRPALEFGRQWCKACDKWVRTTQNRLSSISPPTVFECFGARWTLNNTWQQREAGWLMFLWTTHPDRLSTPSLWSAWVIIRNEMTEHDTKTVSVTVICQDCSLLSTP